MMQLNDQNILVTGASRGIGAEIATTLLKDGAKVVLHGNQNLSPALEIAAGFPDRAEVIKANLEEMDEVDSLWSSALASTGHLDTIVLNAGIFKPNPTSNGNALWLENWRRTMDVNLTSAALLTKLALEHFKQRNGGRFIYIASRAVFRGEAEDYMDYAASKGGLTSLSRTIARSYGKYNIKSFVIAPGFVQTDMAAAYIEEHGDETILSELALPNLTQPKDIAPLVGFIASGAMDHATGSTIDINAGSHIR